MAPAKPFKGWNVLKDACDRLWSDGKRNIELNIYGYVSQPSQYMIVHENGYKYSELPKMMRDADIVVTPSICYETFGFTAVEALSYGVPVVVSSHVGAKDVVGEAGVIFGIEEPENLFNALIFAYNNIDDLKSKAMEHPVKTYRDMLCEIYSYYSC